VGFHHPRPVPQCFRQLSGLDVLVFNQVGVRASELEDAVVGTRRELQLVHGLAHQRALGFVQLAELVHLPGRVSALQVMPSCVGERPFSPSGSFNATKSSNWRWLAASTRLWMAAVRSTDMLLKNGGLRWD
jgi:hypothetical protein